MQRRGPSNTGATGCQCHCVMFKLKHGLLSAHKFCFSLKHVRTFFCNFTENDYCQETPAHNIQPWQHDQNACPTLVVMAFRFWSVNFALMVGTLKQIHQYNGANLNSQGQGKRRKKQIYIPVVFYHLVIISLSDSAYSKFLVKIPQRHQIPLPSKGNKPWMQPNVSHRSRFFRFWNADRLYGILKSLLLTRGKRVVTASMLICCIHHQ